jgi:hypothetical protein
MQKRTIARISLVSGTAALCLGVATPALACTVPMGWSDHATLMSARDPLSAAIARADRNIEAQLHSLNALQTLVTNDSNLTDPQQGSMSQTIANAITALNAEKDAVDSAMSVADVNTALQDPSTLSAVAAAKLDKAIVHADDTIVGLQAKLTKLAAKVAADTSLGANQAKITAAITAAQTVLTTERSNVDSATSTTDVSNDLNDPAVQSAFDAIGLDFAIAHADNQVAATVANLNAFKAKIQADQTLTNAQKATVESKIDDALTALSAEQAAVDAATSKSQLSSDLHPAAVKAAFDAIGLSLAIARADNQIASARTKLSTWLTEVQNDTSMDPTQQAALVAKIEAQQAKLTALQTSVDNATSTGQVASLMRAARFSSRPWTSCDPSKFLSRNSSN